MKECGLFISSSVGYLGASPDGLVYRGGEVCGCIEVKCPFSVRDSTISDACMKPQFFCTKDEKGIIAVKRSHNYFYQIQGQLAVLKLPWCDFIVWTNIDFHVERVLADTTFWNNKCLPKLNSFYYNVMLPEIVYPKHPQLDPIEYNFY